MTPQRSIQILLIRQRNETQCNEIVNNIDIKGFHINEIWDVCWYLECKYGFEIGLGKGKTVNTIWLQEGDIKAVYSNILF